MIPWSMRNRTKPSQDVDPARNRIILVGARRDARKLLHHLDRASREGMTIVGFVDAGHHHLSKPRSRGRHLAVHPRAEPVPVLGGLDRLDEAVDRIASHRPGRRRSREAQAPPPSPPGQVYQVRRHGALGSGGRTPRRCRSPSPISGRFTAGSRGPARAKAPGRAPAVRPDRSAARAAKRLADFLISGLALLILLSAPRPRCAGHPADHRPADLLHPGAGRAGGTAVPDHQVPEHANRRRERDRTDLGLGP